MTGVNRRPADLRCRSPSPATSRCAAASSTITGHYVIHCHILAHEDRGMMNMVEVVPVGTVRRSALRASLERRLSSVSACPLMTRWRPNSIATALYRTARPRRCERRCWRGSKPRPRLLDLGAGSGRIGWPFVAANDDYVGVDLSLRHVAGFKQRAPQVALAQADGCALPFSRPQLRRGAAGADIRRAQRLARTHR